MRQFLEIVKSIKENHHRDQHFNERVNQLLGNYKDQTKQTLSNLDIFHFFENNKKIVLFLIKKCIITISDEICKEIENKIENNGNRYWHFFIPELENIKFVKNELLKENPNFFTNNEEKCQKGENDSYACSLIRKDSIEEFKIYLSSQNISPSSEISPSIFEYSTGSIFSKKLIQIFQYLLKNKAAISSIIAVLCNSFKKCKTD